MSSIATPRFFHFYGPVIFVSAVAATNLTIGLEARFAKNVAARFQDGYFLLLEGFRTEPTGIVGAEMKRN